MEDELIHRIAVRAVELAKQYEVPYDVLWCTMDLSCVHSTTPLRLKELAEADNGNFIHDVFGIRNNLNRETGELENCFSPRFTA